MQFKEDHKRIKIAWEQVFEIIKKESPIKFTGGIFSDMYIHPNQMTVSIARPIIELSIAVDFSEIVNLSDNVLKQLIRRRFRRTLEELQDQIVVHFRKYGEK